jgi:RNA polymerase-binding protein DksA
MLSQIICSVVKPDYRDVEPATRLKETTMATKNQVRELKKKLDKRYFDLHEEIRQELLASDEQRFIDLAGEVHDLEEASVADLLADLDLAILDLHIEEIRDIDAALMRIARNEYGVCLDCGENILIKRLRAYPTAKRCLACQSRYDGSHASQRTPSL